VAAVPAPHVSVVIPSHARPLRLRWLLNSLEEQSLDPVRFEVIVVHDYGDADTRDILDRHPLAERGVLRHIRIEPGTGQPARQRNLGWRDARALLVAFTDDDCRADPGWLQSLLAAAEGSPGAIVQGVTKFEPYEVETWAAPHVRTLDVPNPPNEFLQTCNILYPRALLERLDGFDESFEAPVGEDTDLALRALAGGATAVGARDALIFHAVEEYTLPGMIKLGWKWRHVALLAKRHPRVRREWVLGFFWRREHAMLLAALVGLSTARRFPPGLLAAVPYLRERLLRRGTAKRQLAVAAMELPGQVMVDAAEIATMAAGSARYRTFVL
jgi:glycosyltransferase involved in cell wall biosynthesis